MNHTLASRLAEAGIAVPPDLCDTIAADLRTAVDTVLNVYLGTAENTPTDDPHALTAAERRNGVGAVPNTWSCPGPGCTERGIHPGRDGRFWCPNCLPKESS